MKIKHLLAGVCLILVAGTTYAGRTVSAPVLIDLDNQTAMGDQLTARTAPDETSFIGCGTRLFDFGDGFSFGFGFCQAGDAEGNEVLCITESTELIEEMRANNSYSYITFNWEDDGTGNLTCNRVGFSTQSFYLPADDVPADDDDDSDSDSD